MPIPTSLKLANDHSVQILRPRWPTLYAARKRLKDEAEFLPELPRSLFGWMVSLWKITEDQVLASAGLDAFVVCQVDSCI